MPWEDVINSKHLNRTSLYASLAKLARIQKPLDDYDKSCTIEGSSCQPLSQDRNPISPLSSPQQLQEPSTPIQHHRRSPPSIPPSFTPRSKQPPPFTLQNANPDTIFSSPLSSPPTIIKPLTPSSQRQSLNSESPSQRKLQSKKNSERQEAVGSGETPDEDAQATENQTPHSHPPSSSVTDSRNTRGRNKNPVRYVSDNSLSDDDPNPKRRAFVKDDDFYPSSSQAPSEVTSSEAHNITKGQLPIEHKPEDDVKFTARLFLKELMGFFDQRCQDHHGQWDIDLEDRQERVISYQESFANKEKSGLKYGQLQHRQLRDSVDHRRHSYCDRQR